MTVRRVPTGDAATAVPSTARGATAALSPPVAADRFSPLQADGHQAASISVHPNRLMLEARQLTKEYITGAHKLTVLRDVSFLIPDGAFVAIVGPSRSAATTLRGLLPERAGRTR